MGGLVGRQGAPGTGQVVELTALGSRFDVGIGQLIEQTHIAVLYALDLQGAVERIAGFGIAIAMVDFLAPTLNGADVAGTVRANGLELAYEQFGHDNAPALILIMGLGTQLIGWPDAFCRVLADSGLRVI